MYLSTTRDRLAALEVERLQAEMNVRAAARAAQDATERLRQETQMPVHLAESPLTCVAVGSGKYLEEFDVLVKSKRNSRPRGR